MIKPTLLRSLKYFLTFVGRYVPCRLFESVLVTVHYMKIGRWMYEHGYAFPCRVNSRQEVWSSVAKRIAHRKVLYLEFGVYRGESTRWWSSVLKHPETRLHGFDSFEGLPEDGGPWVKGQFDTGGKMPVIADGRVQFFKGWFDRVLPTYTAPPHDVLVINMDADLYSSTILVLRHLRPYIKPGTYIYFDEINHVTHEARAFGEFLKEARLRFQPVCADKPLGCAVFQCIE